MWRKTESWSVEGLGMKTSVKTKESESGASWDVGSQRG